MAPAVDWSLEALKEHIDVRFQAVDDRLEKIESKGNNIYLPRAEYDTHHTELEKRIDEMRERMSLSAGRETALREISDKTAKRNTATLITIGFLVTVIDVVLHYIH